LQTTPMVVVILVPAVFGFLEFPASHVSYLCKAKDRFPRIRKDWSALPGDRLKTFVDFIDRYRWLSEPIIALLSEPFEPCLLVDAAFFLRAVEVLGSTVSA
jgi:hypothetical protein